MHSFLPTCIVHEGPKQDLGVVLLVRELTDGNHQQQPHDRIVDVYGHCQTILCPFNVVKLHLTLPQVPSRIRYSSNNVYPVSLSHSEHLEYMQFNSRPLTRKLEALDVVHAHVIVELHDGIELLPLLSRNLVLAILRGEGVHLVEDHIPLLLSDFWCTGSSHELREDDL
jgi:hypothetical protein